MQLFGKKAAGYTAVASTELAQWPQGAANGKADDGSAACSTAVVRTLLGRARGLVAGGRQTVDAEARAASLDGLEPSTVTLGPFSEPQGEAIAYDEAGTGVWTISEDPKDVTTQPLHHFACAAP